MMTKGIILMMSIGKIVNTHGLHGELKVFPTTDDIKRYDLLKTVFINQNEYTVEKVRYQQKFVLLKLKTLDDIDSANSLRNFNVMIPRDEALPLEDDEYYIGDLYDMQVYTEADEFLGEITDIIQTGANDVYVTKSHLIPAIKQVILSVDIANKKMIVRLPVGL